jgi:hypothetical protein
MPSLPLSLSSLISTMLLVGSNMEMSKPAHSNTEIHKMETAHYSAFNAQLENVWSASQKSGHAKLLDVHKYNTTYATL